MSGDMTNGAGIQHSTVPEPQRVMLGSCRDLILREPGWLLGAATPVFPKAVLRTRSQAARDLGSTGRAASPVEQVEGSRSRQTWDNAHTGAGSL